MWPTSFEMPVCQRSVSSEAGPFVRRSNEPIGAVHGVAHFPLAALVLGLALSSVERRLEEQALTEGAHATAVLEPDHGRYARRDAPGAGPPARFEAGLQPGGVTHADRS